MNETKSEQNEMRLNAAVLSAVKQFYKDEENVKRFEAWREAREHEKEAREAC